MYEMTLWPADIPLALAIAALGYLLGAIPFGLILARLAGHGDIRNIGSGNIGATNVWRTGNKSLAALTLILDMLKATLAIWIAGQFDKNTVSFAGMGALLGHIFPYELKFKGGKGVSTYVGITIGISPLTALVFIALWLLTAAISRYSSLAALVACGFTPVAAFVLSGSSTAIFFALLSAIVIIKHHENIARLCNGLESRIGGRNSA